MFSELSIESESIRFQKHLDIEDNLRIIFSGIFGIGKTYFINKFFDEHPDNYIPIKINPINYSVSQNEDIFELIKFDIGYQLFSKEIDFEKINFNFQLAAEYFLINNFDNLIPSIFKNISKLNAKADLVINSISTLKEKFDEFKKEIEIDEKKELIEFLKTISQLKGTYREENNITELLNKLILGLKLSYPDKKIVLIIDDLDRIDPEHIFRVMNVFSAHFDHDNFKDENKFGFDKVVLICDIHNIRAIFHSRYGTNIDFTGYIDKFYSLDIYYYNFNKVIEEHLVNFLDSINLSKEVNSDLSFKNGYVRNELIFLLTNLVRVNCISMRSLVNFLKTDLIIPNKNLRTSPFSQVSIYFQSTPIMIVLFIIQKILGGPDSFSNALLKLIEFNPYIEFTIYNNYWDMTIGNIIMLLDFEKNNLTYTQEHFTYHNEEYDLSVVYNIHPIAQYRGSNAKISKISRFNEEISNEPVELSERLLKSKVPYFQLLNDAFSQFKSVITN